MAPDEMITDIFFKGTEPNQASYFIKTALRKAQAISVINISVLITFEGEVVKNSTITMGAVAPTIIHAVGAEAFLNRKTLSDETISQTAQLVAEDASPISDIRGSADYRDYMLSVIAKRALTAIKDGVDKSAIPSTPVLLMGKDKSAGPLEIPWNGKEIHTWINGKEYRKTTGLNKTLLDFIREDIGLTGTKEGCGEGECGACTIYLDGRAVMSCLVPAPRAHGAQIVTIEGLSQNGQLHPVQDAFVKYGAIQCGFCTPGFIMSAVKLLEECETPTQNQIRQAITGNLCRCTGYYKIIEAIEKASKATES
jgi:carbon-monoxide dehydrogenase medium subunit